MGTNPRGLVKAFTRFIAVVTIDLNLNRFNTKNVQVICVPSYRELHLTTRKLNSSMLATATDYCLFKYVGNSKINLRLVGKKKRVVIAPKHMLSSNK